MLIVWGKWFLLEEMVNATIYNKRMVGNLEDSRKVLWFL